MGDSYRTLTVVLNHDVDQDDIDECVNSIKAFRFVADVTKYPVDIGTFTAEARARAAYRDRIMEVLYPKDGK